MKKYLLLYIDVDGRYQYMRSLGRNRKQAKQWIKWGRSRVSPKIERFEWKNLKSVGQFTGSPLHSFKWRIND